MPLTCDNLRLHPLPTGPVLQQRHALDPWRSLRPFRYRDTAYYLLGTVSDWQTHPLDVLTPHILAHEFDVEYPLPEPTDLSAAFRTLPEAVRIYAVRYLLGYPLNDTLRDLGVTEAQAPLYAAALQESGIALLRNSDVNVDLGRHEFTHRTRIETTTARQEAQAEQMMYAADPDAPVPPPVTRKTTIVAPGQPQPEYHKVMPISEEMMNRIARRTSDDGPDRMTWPFRNMEPGTQVRIPSRHAVRAQRAAHVFASRKGWAMRTMRDPITGDLYVIRMPKNGDLTRLKVEPIALPEGTEEV